MFSILLSSMLITVVTKSDGVVNVPDATILPVCVISPVCVVLPVIVAVELILTCTGVNWVVIPSSSTADTLSHSTMLSTERKMISIAVVCGTKL